MKLPETIHQDDLASFLNLTVRRINGIADERGITKPQRGVFVFQEIVLAILEDRKKKDTPAKERLDAAKASREERKDRQESGEDISANVVTKAWEQLVVTVRQRFLRIGNNVQSKLGLTEAQRAAVDSEVREALGELAKKLTYAAQVAEDDDEKGVEVLK